MDTQPNVTKVKAERAFWIITQFAMLGVVTALIGMTYGWLLGTGISLVIFFAQNFLVLRIYNLKRCVNMLIFLQGMETELKKLAKEDEKENK